MRKCCLILWAVWIIQFAMAIDPPKQEIRGVWLTTIFGLDWPHKPAITEEAREVQKRDLCNILDKLQKAHFNMVFFQVRMRGDVNYKSKVEPASNITSGKYGEMPGYDPLAFAIEECHKRGMECHAWFITFPVGSAKSVKSQGNWSVVKRHPNLCKLYNGEWFLNPGLPETSDYILSLVKEVVNDYDIDGVHFDWIRYPGSANKFPDRILYKKSGTKLPLADWRRENINKIVYRIYDWVKSVKPYVVVSSAPLGKYSRIPSVPNAGWTGYETVYQDAENWIRAGKQDMIVPMMYYLHNNFFPFVDNWVENSNGRLIVPGLGAYRMTNSEGDWTLNDITDQIDYSRYYGGAGCAFFRCSNVVDNIKGLYDELANNYYKYPALLPPLKWLDNSTPKAPEEICVERINGALKLSWKKPKEEKQSLTYTVYCSKSDSLDYTLSKNILVTNTRDTTLYFSLDSDAEQEFTFSVSASTRFHIESKPSRETYYYFSKYIK